MTELLLKILIYLSASVIAVPLSKKFGLGSVLGYLIAGIVIGPLLGLAGDETHKVQHVAEFGVVMMLFLVGLELEPKVLWSLRHKLLGLGGLQVLLTTLLIAALSMLIQLPWQTAVAVGLVLSLSSTAIILQTLNEQGLMKSVGGQSSFSVLLFQDIAVIPMLAMIPLLALPDLYEFGLTSNIHGENSVNLLAGMSGILKTAVTLSAIALIILVGHFLVSPLFRIIAKTGLREMFTAFALTLIVGIAVLMSVIGLSPALGAFLAGVVLAESEYRHELESTIEPFKGLLLGLFFITVGAGMNLGLLSSNFGQILAITLSVMLVKFLVLFGLGKLFKLKGMYQWLFALSLAQAGEFGFVLLSFTVKSYVIPQNLADTLLLVIALSMMLTPLLFIFFDKVIEPRQTNVEQQADEIDTHSSVIIAGNGRFGQVVNRVLMNSGYTPTVIDLDADSVAGFAKYGIKTFFGDASRPELLEASRIREASVFVIAINDRRQAVDIARYARQTNPNLIIIARAYDRNHVYELHGMGANHIIRETFDSSVRASKYALESLGIPDKKAKRVTEIFFKRDRIAVKELSGLYDPSLPRFANQAQFEAFIKINEETIEKIHKILGKDMAEELQISDDEENELDAKIVKAMG